MDRQSLGILLCALVLTTLGHEIVNRHHLGHSARLVNGHDRKSHFAGRSLGTTPDQCAGVVCHCPIEPSGSGNLTIHFNTTTEIIWILNVTAHVAVVIDLNEGYIATFNQSVAFVISLETEDIVIVNQNFTVDENFLITITSLCDYFDDGEKTTPEEASIQIREVLILVSYGTLITGSAQNTITTIIKIGVDIRSLKPYLKFINSGHIVIETTIQRFAEIIVGVVYIFSYQSINQGLTQSGHKIDVQVIFEAQSSLVILLDVLALLPKDSVASVFSNFTNSETLFAFFANTTGGDSLGVNGVVNIIAVILHFCNGRAPISAVFEALVEYFTSSRTHSVTQQWNEAISGLINLIVKLNIQDRVSFVYKLLLKIQKGTWEDCSIDISAIISLLLEVKASDYLSVIFKIIYLLRGHIVFQVGLVQFFLYLLRLLTHRGGLAIVVAITGIQVSSSWYSSDNVLYEIIKGLNFKSSSNVVQSFSKLSIISEIIAKFDVTLKSGGYNISFEGALTSNFAEIFEYLYLVFTKGSGGTGTTWTWSSNGTVIYYNYSSVETHTKVYTQTEVYTVLGRNKKDRLKNRHRAGKHD